jgi:hypothetical protein
MADWLIPEAERRRANAGIAPYRMPRGSANFLAHGALGHTNRSGPSADHHWGAFIGVWKLAKKASPFGGSMKTDTRSALIR